MNVRYFSALLVSLLTLTTSASALILIDDVMTVEVQKKTGVYYLNHNQRRALEAWLDQNCILKNAKTPQTSTELTLSENLNNGRRLQLSDGSIYEVAPTDVSVAAGWITPFPIQVMPSGDAYYPCKLVNKNNGNSIYAKLIYSPNPPPSTP